MRSYIFICIYNYFVVQWEKILQKELAHKRFCYQVIYFSWTRVSGILRRLQEVKWFVNIFLLIYIVTTVVLFNFKMCGCEFSVQLNCPWQIFLRQVLFLSFSFFFLFFFFSQVCILSIYIYVFRVFFFFFLVWIALGLNPGFSEHWRTHSPLCQQPGIYIYIYIYVCACVCVWFENE